VQYAALLSPPQHRTSLLRLQPAAQKGLAATETNTLVFMVLEGEVTVLLNTTCSSSRAATPSSCLLTTPTTC
jgi:hypothetical protein